jgi:hypothetical protein
MRYNFDSTGATVTVAILTPGFLMMALGFIGTSPVSRLILALAVGLVVLIALWIGLVRGTSVTVDENKNVCGRVFFIRGKVTPLSDVLSIKARKTFAGLMTEVYMTYRKNDGTVVDRGLVSKETLRKEDFTKLLEAISAANPNIEISRRLLTK